MHLTGYPGCVLSLLLVLCYTTKQAIHYSHKYVVDCVSYVEDAEDTSESAQVSFHRGLAWRARADVGVAYRGLGISPGAMKLIS